MPFAYVGKDTTIGARTTIHPGVKIGAGVRLGEDCLIWPNVVIREGAIIGSRVIVHPGAVIGADGFGYAKREGRYIKVRHVGIVVIEDDVEIGANATVDRGTLGRTWIKRGVKLDNLVHIAHNVEVGEDTVMAAQCGISGSTVIGNRVMMGGQVGLVDHLQIGDEALFIAQSGVIGNIPPRAKVSGYPARSHREVLRAHAAMRGLDRLRDKVRSLEKKVSELIQDQGEEDPP
jgi:UDP-3-O-[3-hydroxymyristoyl] glucosamine N-acyltransferase